MRSIQYSPRALADFQRVANFLSDSTEQDADARVGALVAAIDVLAQNPHIGRLVNDVARELIIGAGAHGYVALYEYWQEWDTIIVLRVRARREGSYPD